MNTGHRPHPAAPRIPLIVPVAVLFAAIFGVVYVLVTFFGGRPDGLFTAPLGAPLTAVLLLATVALTSWWFLRGEVRHARLAALSAALVILPAAGLLGVWQGVEPAAQRYGGVAGRNLAWFMLRILETGSGFALAAYGALLVFGLYFLKQAAAAAAVPEDASAVLARLARARAGVDAPPAEIPPPSADEALGIPRPLAGERELFDADAETMPLGVEAPAEENVSETAFLAAADEPEPEAPVAVEEPPPPPKRRRVLEDILPEEEDRPDEEATLVVPIGAAGAAAPVGLHELFGQGVIDADDDEDVLAPRRVETPVAVTPAEDATVAATAAAAPSPVETEDAPAAPAFRVVSADEETADPTPPVSIASLLASAAVAPAAPSALDDRESVDDATEELGVEREEERPLFAPPPRLLPYEDDDVGDVDDLPADDDASARRVAAPLTDAVVEDAVPAPESFAFDPEITPPPSIRYDADGEGARTGETPRRALWSEEEIAAAKAENAPTPELFSAAPEVAAEEEEPTPAKRRRARAPRVKRAEAEGAAADDAGVADAAAEIRSDDAPLAAPLFATAAPPAEAEAPPEAPAPPAEAAEDENAAAAAVAPAPATPAPRAVSTAARRPAPSAPADEFEVLTARATEVVVGAQRCSPSLLQRELGIRFVEAAAVIERLHQRGVVGPHTPSGVREVLVRAGSAGA